MAATRIVFYVAIAHDALRRTGRYVDRMRAMPVDLKASPSIAECVLQLKWSRAVRIKQLKVFVKDAEKVFANVCHCVAYMIRRLRFPDTANH